MPKLPKIDQILLDVDGLPSRSFYDYVARYVEGAKTLGETIERDVTLVDVGRHSSGEVPLHIAVDPSEDSVILTFRYDGEGFYRVHSLQSETEPWLDDVDALAYEGSFCSGLLERRFEKVAAMFDGPGDPEQGVLATRRSVVGGTWLLVDMDRFPPIDAEGAPSKLAIIYADEDGGCDPDGSTMVAMSVDVEDSMVASADEAHAFMAAYEDSLLDYGSDETSSVTAPPYTVSIDESGLRIEDETHGVYAIYDDEGEWHYGSTREDGAIDADALDALRSLLFLLRTSGTFRPDDR